MPLAPNKDWPARFWRKVKVGTKGSCWPWLGAKSPDGYGHASFWIQGRHQTFYAHRMAFELINGTLLPGFMVCHQCDVKLCCNPHHLFAGTNSINVRDHIIKCRQSGRPYGNMKLNHADIPEILSLWTSGLTMAAIGRRYGVSWSCIRMIIRSRHWIHIEALPQRSILPKRPKTILAEESVVFIRVMRWEMSAKELAQWFRVSPATIFGIWEKHDR